MKTGKILVVSQAKMKAMKEKLNAPYKMDADVRLIEEIYNPIVLKKSEVLIASDWHGDRYDRNLKKELFKVADEMKIDTLMVPGDFFDCDAYSTFTRYNHEITFRHEVGVVSELLEELTSQFKKIVFCRGNHEKRWISLNGGMMSMDDLFSLTGVNKGYEVSMDDHMILHSGDQDWRVCHPKDFSKTIFKIPKTLADKYEMNIFAAHGHRLGWCMDDSGVYQCVEGGGMFDKRKLDYLRDTSAFPEVASGFWAVLDGWACVYPGRRF